MSPTIVGAVRGVILAGVAAMAGAALEVVSAGTVLPSEAWWLPLVIIVLRTLEGRGDKAIGQKPQAGLLGGGPEDPSAYLVR